MATQSATFIFALPEDESSDQLLIYVSDTKTGTYSLDATETYNYGETTFEYDTLDDTKWYKIKFNNSSDSEAGPISAPVYGGDFAQGNPFLAISTGTDGAQFATVDEVYSYSTLTAAQVPRSRISEALRRARAVIDLRTVEFDIDRFTKTWDSKTSRKKFNAQLRILKEAEINIALGHIYRGLADDKVIAVVTGTVNDAGSISIGNTSISDAPTGGTSATQQMSLLAALGDRYLTIGSAMISVLSPSSIRIHYHIDVGGQKFKFPFNGVV